VTGTAPCAGFVLAGGYSTRFGRDKALVEIGGKPVLVRMCGLVAESVTPNVRVIGAPSKYEILGVKCVDDRWPGEGPLGGIITALMDAGKTAATPEWNLIIGCDLPFMVKEMLAVCVGQARKSDADVVVPKSASGLEPLCACWRTDCAARLLAAFEQGTRKVTEAMKHLRMEILDETHWKRFDNGGRLFWNMNTVAEYEEAKRLLEAGRV